MCQTSDKPIQFNQAKENRNQRLNPSSLAQHNAHVATDEGPLKAGIQRMPSGIVR